MFDTWFIFFNYILSIIGIHLNWPMTGFELETFGTESDHLGNFLQVLVHYCWQIIWKKGLDINLMKWNIVCRGGMPRAESDKRILWPLPDLAAPKNISRKSLNWVGGGSLWHKLELTFWHTHSAPPPSVSTGRPLAAPFLDLNSLRSTQTGRSCWKKCKIREKIDFLFNRFP